jgi:predicted secreted protein
MSITGAVVLFAVFWFMTFLVVLPIGLRTQGDMGKVEPGTHSSAPAEAQVKRKAWITTGVAAVLWAITASVIIWGGITVRDIDFYNRMDPPGVFR